jgi:hypothetical protein
MRLRTVKEDMMDISGKSYQYNRLDWAQYSSRTYSKSLMFGIFVSSINTH